MSWLVGTDIGGTFTDIVAVEPDSGETRVAKVPSRPDAPVDAMLDAIAAVGLRTGEVARFVHGTTRVTNAIVQDRLPPIALIATAGFEDVLEIGRYRRRDLYDLTLPPKAPPLVPHERCFGLAERLDHTGAVTLAPDAAELDRMVAWVAASGVQSVAVSLLHAYANPAHELLVAERLRGVVPFLSLSHEINPEAREYERTSSTTINAAAMPIAAGYLSELEERLPLGPGLQVFHSAGGMVSTATAKRRPIVMAMSGPAAGVAASVGIARQLGLLRVLTFDMGGTTTDVCLVVDGEAAVTDTSQKGDRPLRQPMLAVQSIGAGGGSIVHRGAGGLAVGPQSAGVVPGPACYGNGGSLPTITDANAVLGYLDPAARLGSEIRIDVDAARTALAPIAAALGLDIVQTALGIIQVANATMARALRRVTVERGVDGRDCALLAFGGGGPMHAAGLADIYGLDEIIVPAASSAFSALGCLTADQSFLHQQSVRLTLDGLDPADLERRLVDLRRIAMAPLLDAGLAAADIELSYVALQHYEAQSDTTAIPFTLPVDLATLRADFQAQHHRLYGYSTAEPSIIEGVRVQARVPSTTQATRPRAGTGQADGTRICSFPGAVGLPTAIIARDGLDRVVAGPAIITDAWSTIVVPPGWQAAPAEGGHLRMTRSAA